MGYETKHKGKFKQSLFSSYPERVQPGVTLPSEYLTPKQISELSGPVHIYYIDGKENEHENNR